MALPVTARIRPNTAVSLCLEAIITAASAIVTAVTVTSIGSGISIRSQECASALTVTAPCEVEGEFALILAQYAVCINEGLRRYQGFAIALAGVNPREHAVTIVTAMGELTILCREAVSIHHIPEFLGVACI